MKGNHIITRYYPFLVMLPDLIYLYHQISHQKQNPTLGTNPMIRNTSGSRHVATLVLSAISLFFSSIPMAQVAITADSLSQLPTAHWLTNGGNLANQRYSPLTRINRDNVANLKAEWEVHLGSGSGPQNSSEAQPIIADGVAYIVSGDNDVFAIDIETGNFVWAYYAKLNPLIDVVCCGWTSRGVAISDDKVFVGQLDGKLTALDRSNGAVVWQIQAEEWEEGFSITSAPLYYDGLVITGFSGGELGIRGRVKAYDANDGSLTWTFYTIPGPGEPGHQTWEGDNDLWQHGGAPVWQTPAVDPELDLLYFSTGNAGPDFNGQHRPGDNLFTASVLALDIYTGEYRWHFQEVHHDIWDYDASNPVILFDLEYNGEPRKGIAQAGKTGWVYILDRITGEPLVGIEERDVPQRSENATAQTQPYPLGDAFIPQEMSINPEGFDLVNNARIFTPYYDEAVVISPGMAGGANWPPSAIDPNKGHMYVCAVDRPMIFQAAEISSERPEPGTMYTGGGFLGFPLWNLGIIAAMDLRDNTIVWQRHLQQPCNSGITATASGLLFVGRNDGRLTALNSDNGNILWQFQTSAGMNAPVSIFEHKGKQYVMGYSGGNVLGGTSKGDSVWLFSLEGTIAEGLPPGSDQAAILNKEPAPGPADMEAGMVTFNTVCAACHGVDGRGGHGGGISLENADTPEFVISIVNQGRNTMPALAAALSPEQLRDVGAYVSTSLSK